MLFWTSVYSSTQSPPQQTRPVPRPKPYPPAKFRSPCGDLLPLYTDAQRTNEFDFPMTFQRACLLIL